MLDPDGFLDGKMPSPRSVDVMFLMSSSCVPSLQSHSFIQTVENSWTEFGASSMVSCSALEGYLSSCVGPRLFYFAQSALVIFRGFLMIEWVRGGSL